jgi:NAD(P)-dependent dehydrogenase (short-subunit alcohol dehydrogenase family)
VTGASSGIGRACALDLDRRGFRVFAGVRSEEDAEALRREGTHPVMLDVTDAEAIAALRETVERELGADRLVGIVNNAGIGTGGPLEALDLDALRRTLEVNTVAPIAIAQQFIPRLRADRGRVVNVTSIGGRIAQPFLGPYSASKFGLEALSDVMRRELLPWGIHVAAIEPGNVKTRIWEKGTRQIDDVLAHMTDEQRRLYAGNIERMGKLVELAQRTGAKPERVAKAIVHALTADRPRARYLVGVDARVQLAIDRLLPTRLGDRVMSRLAGS